MKKIILSYSALNDLIQWPHTWLNKQMGFKIPETPYMTAGKEAHLAIQRHLLGAKDRKLDGLDWKFQKSEYHARKNYTDKYILHGFLDAISFDSKVICEIKTSNNPWSQQKFDASIQWRYYSFVTDFRKILFITCKPDLSNLKTYYREISDQDLKQAEEWVNKGLSILEEGNFTKYLDGGKCDGTCSYRENCYFA